MIPNSKTKKQVAYYLRMLAALVLVAVPLLVGQQTTASVTQALGATPELFNITGLEAPEKGEGGTFRWSDETVAMQLQPLGYPLYAVLHVQGVRPEGEPEAVIQATSAGKALGTQVIPRSPITVEYKLPAAAIFSINPQIEVTSTLFQPPGDRRQLGIVYYSLEHRNGPGPSVPAPWPAAALLLSGLLAYLALLRLFGRSTPAFAGTAAWGLLIGVLNAFERPWLVFYSWYFPVLPLLILLVYPWLAGMRRVREPQVEAATRDHPAIAANGWPLAIAVTASAVGLMLWHAGAPQERPGNDPTDNLTWGVSFYRVLPWPLQVLGLAAIACALVWAYFAPLAPKLIEQRPESPAINRNMPLTWFPNIRIPLLLAAIGVALFTLIPVAYSEGDSDEFDTKIQKGAIWRERELLDFYLKVRLWRILQPVLRLPSQVYALVAVLAGGVYMAGTWLVGRTLGRDRTEAYILVGALVSIGNMLIFFRYVESYALVTVVSLFVLWACWRYTEGRLSFGAVGALATLAPFVHGSALWWGPMVVAAWLLRARSLPPSIRWRHAIADMREGVGVGAALTMLIISVMLIDAYDFERFQEGLSEMGGADGRTMLPLFTPQTRFEHYSFFSIPHLGAVIQEQLLVAPMALLTIAIIAFATWGGVVKLAKAVPSLVTLAVGAAGMFFYSISWNPDLGPRNDWDLLALSALPLTMLAAYLLVHMPYGRPRRIAITAYLAVSAVHAAGWVALHALGLRY